MTTAPDAPDTDRRRATVVFVDILGATALSERAGIERAYAIVTGSLRVLDGIARRHGGVVDKYLSDCLMAVFGFPIQSASAPLAAVAAAVEMLEATARYAAEVQSPLPLTLRIGINTGFMIAGDLRGPIVREFAVLGDAVNVAARLKDVGAAGGIHVGAETHAAATARFTFEALEPLALRGKAEPVPAFRVVPPPPGGRRAPGGPPALVETPLLGRDRECALLRDALVGARAGTGRAVVVVGEEGAGKSRLVTELCRDAAAAGLTVLAGRAMLAHRDAPLHVVADLVSDWAGIAVADDVPTVCRKLAETAAILPGFDAEGLGAILTGRVSATDGDTLERALTGALAALAARGPVLVACEDLQWADAASVALIARLARASADRPVLWLLTARPEGDVRAALETALPERSGAVTLGPLAPDDAARLVDHVTGGAALTPVARGRIETRAAGNPFRLILGALLAGAVETEVAHEAATVERASEAERRRVTVLFADITGFTRMSERLPPAETYRAVGGCLQILHEVAAKHGGSVDKYLGDCIMAVFGVPIAVEDAPRAAVNAAIEMRRRVREYNATASLPSPLDIHVGINTGLGVAGDISGPLLREFTLMGDAVSVASKLKDVAPAGQIWVGAGTERTTRSRFDYEAVPTAVGDAWALRSEREQVYRARVGRGETIFAELVGRDEELSALRGAVARLASGQGAVAGVIGEAGLGKSRLLAELAATPEGHGVRWVEGRSIAMGRTQRFHPFVDLLRSLLGLGEHTAEELGALETALAPLLGPQCDELAPYLAMLLGVPLPVATAERVAGIRADVIDRLQLRAVRELLHAAARTRPLVVLFEDVHWADRSSVELLGGLLRLVADAAVLVLFAARPGFPETSGRLLDLARATLPPERLLEVELRPLDAAATTRLLGTLFPHGALPRASRERIARHAGGNPLYIEELLRSLIEQGAVEATAGGLRATAAIESIVVPATVQEVILTRVDHLQPRPKQTLQLAAVVGQRVAEPVLAALVAEPALLPETLDGLVDAQLLLREAGGDPPHYGFKHRLIQEVTYDSILETRRAELHRAVGTVVEEHLRGAPGYHGMLAYHYSMGNDLERAEEQLFLAGDDAARAGAPMEALELLQESSRLYLARHPGGGDPAKRVALHKRLAGAHLHRGQMDDAQRHYDEALSVLGEVIPASRLAVGLALARTLGLVALDLYLFSGGAARRPPASARDLEIIDLMFNRARAQMIEDAARFVLNGLETLRKLRGIDPATVPGAGGMYAGTVGLFSFGGISFDVSRRFLELARRYVDPSNVPEAFFWRVMSFTHWFVAGDWDDRHEIPSADLDEAVRLGLLWDVSVHLGLETFKRMAQGRWAECAPHIDRLEHIEEAYAYNYARSTRQAAIAFLHTERRQLHAAEAASETYFRSHDETLLNLLALGTKAKVQVLREDLDAARTTLDTADGLITQRVPPWYSGFVSRSHLLLAAAEAERSGTVPAATRRRVRRHQNVALRSAARFAWIQPEVWATIGRLRWSNGRRRAALRWFGRALDEAERLRMRPEAARIRLDVGARLLAAGSGARFRGEEASGLLRAARGELEALDLAWDIERLEDVLARLEGRPLAAAVG